MSAVKYCPLLQLFSMIKSEDGIKRRGDFFWSVGDSSFEKNTIGHIFTGQYYGLQLEGLLQCLFYVQDVCYFVYAMDRFTFHPIFLKSIFESSLILRIFMNTVVLFFLIVDSESTSSVKLFFKLIVHCDSLDRLIITTFQSLFYQNPSN